MPSNFQINLLNSTKNQLPDLDLSKITSAILHDASITGILVIIDIKICGTSYIRRLNKKFRQIDKPTDVLSFPLFPLFRGKPKASYSIQQDTPLHLGDIVICYEVAVRQAKENNITLKEEIEKLYGHGLKHLLGFHHR